MTPRRMHARAIARIAIAVVITSCSGPILANPAASRPAGPSATVAPAAVVDPQPITFPRDDGAHHRLTEWWYYTGHLRDDAGHRYGFEFVVFRAERGAFGLSWASHLALTDETAGRFHYAQRSDIGPQVDVASTTGGEPTGFDLRILGTAGGLDAASPGASEATTAPPWTMSGSNGRDKLDAALSPGEAAAAGLPEGFELHLELAPLKLPALHDGDGWVDFGAAGGSYYYSRTSMTAAGSLGLGGRTTAVDGTAWFDHQWGDFIAVGGGGWDWFALNLDNGLDVCLSIVRAPDGSTPLVYGTLVEPDGTVRHLDRAAFTVSATSEWRSPSTGITYPSGWLVTIPAEGLRLELTPTVPDQELDTRSTTGVVYWEGSQLVRATRWGRPLRGQAYVELTGYGP